MWTVAAIFFGGLAVQVSWLGLRVGGQPALSLHSSNEPGELSQWLRHDDSTINIISVIIIIIIINLVPAKGRWCSAAGKATAGLAEYNGSLSLTPGEWYL